MIAHCTVVSAYTMQKKNDSCTTPHLPVITQIAFNYLPDFTAHHWVAVIIIIIIIVGIAIIISIIPLLLSLRSIL